MDDGSIVGTPPPRDDRTLVGRELAGYRLESVIGRGGMGVVYLADHARLKRKAAVKVLAPQLGADPSFRERFVRESLIAASLDHPNVIPIYDAGDADDVLYIAMRYVPGLDLSTVLVRGGALDTTRALSIVRQVAGALDAAHSRGLIHRDVKPGNILLADSDGRSEHAYLVDFGLARDLAYGGLTESGQLVGTADYIAPEVVENKPIDGRADIYALGCLLFETLSGKPPYQRSGQLATMWAHVNEAVPHVREGRADLPEALDVVIRRAMAKRPEDRFATATEFADAAESAMREEPVAATPQPTTTSVSRSPERRRLAVLAVVAVAALIAVPLLAYWATRNPDSTPAPSATAAGDGPNGNVASLLPSPVPSPSPAATTSSMPSAPTVAITIPAAPVVQFVDDVEDPLIVLDPEPVARVAITWTAIGPATGWTFAAETSFDNVTWTEISNPADASLKIARGLFLGDNYVRVVPVDPLGARGEPSPTLGVRLYAYQSSHTEGDFSNGDWSGSISDNDFIDTAKAARANARVEITASNVLSMAWVAPTGPGLGDAEVTVGEETLPFTLTSPEAHLATVIYYTPLAGTHDSLTMSVRVVKAPVEHDAFLVLHDLGL